MLLPPQTPLFEQSAVPPKPLRDGDFEGTGEKAQ
jgi:hypothetical protein